MDTEITITLEDGQKVISNDYGWTEDRTAFEFVDKNTGVVHSVKGAYFKSMDSGISSPNVTVDTFTFKGVKELKENR